MISGQEADDRGLSCAWGLIVVVAISAILWLIFGAVAFI